MAGARNLNATISGRVRRLAVVLGDQLDARSSLREEFGIGAVSG